VVPRRPEIQAVALSSQRNAVLSRNGADIDAEGGSGTALQAACYKGHKMIAELLLKNGANANAVAGLYINALGAASSAGYKLLVKWLLENGANVNDGNALKKALWGGEHG
jgi:ankyrin repeat protein